MGNHERGPDTDPRALEVTSYIPAKDWTTMAVGWPNYLRAIAATAILTKEALKLTLGQTLQIIAPHAIESMLCSPPDQ